MVVEGGGRTRVKIPSYGLGLARFELPTGTERMSTYAFLSMFPGMGHRKRGVVGLESCQQISKMEPDCLLYTSYLSRSFLLVL